MKKQICTILAAGMLCVLTACGETQSPGTVSSTAAEWTRHGYYADNSSNTLSIIWMEDVDEPGWYVGVMLGEYPDDGSYGGTVPQVGNSLHGTITDIDGKSLTVTVTEEGTDGMQMEVEGGETYHFSVLDLPAAEIFVTINTEGWGNIDYAEGEEAPEIDYENPYQSSQIALGEAATYTFAAWPKTGNVFVKWTKNGEDFSAEPQITVLLDESADYVAVFEADPDWVNPISPYVGSYQSGRTNAEVMAFMENEAWITISWAISSEEVTTWLIVGSLDPETGTITYSGSSKTNAVYDEEGNIKNEEQVYEDGTGTITFHEDGTFTWHEDQSETGEDLVFEPLPAQE